MQGLLGKWICELSELAAFRNTKDWTAVKSFITRTSDHFRLPYGRATEDYPRACAFAATTNPAHSNLPGETGTRRFWPIRVTKMLDFDRFEATVDQLWAEAVHLFRSGELLFMDTAHEEVARRLQKAQIAVNEIFHPVIEGYVNSLQVQTRKGVRYRATNVADVHGLFDDHRVHMHKGAHPTEET